MMLRPFSGTLGLVAGLVPTAMRVLRLSYTLGAARVSYANVRRVFETGGAGKHLDVIARQLRFGHIDFRLDDVLHAEGKIGHRDLVFDAIIHAINGAVVVAGKVKHAFAKSFAGDGAGVDADAADKFALLHHGDALAQLGGRNCRSLSGRARPEDEQVKYFHRSFPSFHSACQFYSLLSAGCR